MCGQMSGRFSRNVRSHAAVCIFTVVVCGFACSNEEPLPQTRPANVPSDTVRIQGAKAHWWARCDSSNTAPRCQVYNAGGLLLYDAIFVVHAPPGSADSGTIKIAPERSDATYLWLQDGRVLFPPEVYTKNARELIDDLAIERNAPQKK
jgi:hypothetical protein